jgi:hypothetical protein
MTSRSRRPPNLSRAFLYTAARMHTTECRADTGVLLDEGDGTVKIVAAEQDLLEQLPAPRTADRAMPGVPRRAPVAREKETCKRVCVMV